MLLRLTAGEIYILNGVCRTKRNKRITPETKMRLRDQIDRIQTHGNPGDFSIRSRAWRHKGDSPVDWRGPKVIVKT